MNGLFFHRSVNTENISIIFKKKLGLFFQYLFYVEIPVKLLLYPRIIMEITPHDGSLPKFWPVLRNETDRDNPGPGPFLAHGGTPSMLTSFDYLTIVSLFIKDCRVNNPVQTQNSPREPIEMKVPALRCASGGDLFNVMQVQTDFTCVWVCVADLMIFFLVFFFSNLVLISLLFRIPFFLSDGSGKLRKSRLNQTFARFWWRGAKKRENPFFGYFVLSEIAC